MKSEFSVSFGLLLSDETLRLVLASAVTVDEVRAFIRAVPAVSSSVASVNSPIITLLVADSLVTDTSPPVITLKLLSSVAEVFLIFNVPSVFAISDLEKEAFTSDIMPEL